MLHHPSALRRRTLLGAAASLPAAGLLGACSGGEDEPEQADGPPDRVTYLTNFGTLGRDSYAWLALENGHFAAANLDVTIESGTGTGDNLRGLLSGQAEFAAVDLAGAAIYWEQLKALRLRAAGGDEEAAEELGEQGHDDEFIAIAAIHQQQLGSVMAYEGSGIAGPPDLHGRAVGLPPGALTELLFPAWLDQAGANVDEVEQVPLAPGDLTTALAAGEVDAIGQFVVGEPLVKAAGGGREVEVLPYSDYLADLFGVGLFTTQKRAEQEPQVCIRFRDALLAGLQDAMDDPEAAAEALARHIRETDPEVAAAEMQLMVPYSQIVEPALGYIDSQRLAQHIGTLSGSGLLGDNPSLTPPDLVAFKLIPGEQS